MQDKRIRILGTRGIPAGYGGFETFAEHLALYLVARGWEVTVYCQHKGSGKPYEQLWNGVRLYHIPVQASGPRASFVFDWKATWHAAKAGGLVLTLGYNTAVFSLVHRMRGQLNLINMDGFEWKRPKWSAPVRAWLYANERLGCWLGDHLIADHPEIKAYLTSRVSQDKIAVIPYGADRVENADPLLLQRYGLTPHGYALVIARPEPENSIREIVTAFSHKPRGMPLVVLGNYNPTGNPYHQEVIEAAGAEVKFIGAVYEKRVVQALRFFANLYVHGHQVGGTNPSLVEALGAGSAVLAHDNPFNRWVAGTGAEYFRDEDSCAALLEQLLIDPIRLQAIGEASRARFEEQFTWDKVLDEYESLLMSWLTYADRSQAVLAK